MRKVVLTRHAGTLGIVALLWLALATPASAQAAPTFSKTFGPDTIGPGSVSTLTFTITNGSASPVTMLAFTDNLPAAVTIAAPANATTDCTDGVLVAPDDGGTISLSAGTVATLSTCSVTVDVISSTPGTHMNVSGDLTSDAGNSGTATDDLTVDTSLPGFSKSFSPSTVPLGDRSTLTFTIDNTLNGALFSTYIGFTDNLPTGMEIADPTNASTDCTGPLTAVAGTSTISLGFGSIFGGATCSITVDVTATGAGMLDNVTGELTLSPSGSSGKASATLDVTVTTLSLQKSFTDDEVPPGGTVTLEFVIDNFDRIFGATAIGFTDDLTTLVPALAGFTFDSLLANDCGGSVMGVGTTLITFSGGTLAPESSCTIGVSLMVPIGTTPGIYTNTTGAITGTIDSSPVVGNMASDDLFVEPVPLLTKLFVGDPVNAGDTVVLRFTIENTSTTSMATGITFLDELTDFGPGTGFLPFPVTVTLPPVPDPPCGAGSSLTLAFIDTDRQGLSLTGGTLDPAPGAGSTCTFEVTLTIPSDQPPAVYVNTTEEITATVDGATRTGNTASDTLTVIGAPSLTKVFTDDPVEPGGTVTLEFTLTYPADASGDATLITFTDDLAPVLAGLTANLPPTPDPPCGAGSTLTVSAGDTLLTFAGGTLTPGGSCTFSVTLDVPAGAVPGSHANTTSGVSATVEGLPATSAPAFDDLKVAGLTFTKEFLGDPVIPGDTVTLRFTIDNIHPSDDATSMIFTDNLNDVLPGTPDLTLVAALPTTPCGPSSSIIEIISGFLFFTGGEVLQGNPPCSFDLTLLVPAGAADGTYANITSALSATQSGGPVTIDPATDTLTVDSNLLQLTKAFTDDPVAPGDSVTLEFTLTNFDAGQAASAIDFSDDLDSALTGLVATGLPFAACGGTVDAIPDAGTIDFSGGSLAAGVTCMFSVSLSVPGAAAANIYTNTTSAVSGTIGGLAVTGDAASDDLEVLQLLLFSKSFDGPTTATGAAVLTFTITNPGASTAAGIAFSDDLNSVISGLIAISLPALPCGAGSSLTGTSFLTFTGGELPPSGGMCSFDVDVLVPATATAGTFPNTTSDLTAFGLKVSDPATDALLIVEAPVLSKSFIDDPVAPGGTVTLEFTLVHGVSVPVDATGIAFSDDLDAALTGLVATGLPFAACGGTVDAIPDAGTIDFSGGSLTPGASCTFSVVLQVPGTAVGGSHTNTTSAVTATLGGLLLAASPATDDLVVDELLNFSKVFLGKTFPGATTKLTFTIQNNDLTHDATDIGFTDDLDSVISGFVATGLPSNNICGPGSSLTGTSVLTLSGGNLTAGSSCTFEVTLQVPIAAEPGIYTNITSVIQATANGVLSSSAAAIDTLIVLPPRADLIFADGFESGDTSAWSAQVP